jgi:hypothetical protein
MQPNSVAGGASGTLLKASICSHGGQRGLSATLLNLVTMLYSLPWVRQPAASATLRADSMLLALVPHCDAMGTFPQYRSV